MKYESKLIFEQNRFEEPMKCLGFSVLQLGETYANENTFVDNHVQVCDEISYIASGKAVMYQNGIPYELEKGDCFLSFRGERHRIEAVPGKAPHFCFIGFSCEDENMKELIRRLQKEKRRIPLKEAEEIFSEMIRELWEGKAYEKEAIGSLLYKLLILLRRNFEAESNSVPESSLIYRITVYLENHIREPDAVGHLGEVFFLNGQTLADAFRKAMGESLHHYFQRLRMEKASDLLRSGNTVTETAAILGYSSIHPFSRAYKNAFGFSPKAEK